MHTIQAKADQLRAAVEPHIGDAPAGFDWKMILTLALQALLNCYGKKGTGPATVRRAAKKPAPLQRLFLRSLVRHAAWEEVPDEPVGVVVREVLRMGAEADDGELKAMLAEASEGGA